MAIVQIHKERIDKRSLIIWSIKFELKGDLRVRWRLFKCLDTDWWCLQKCWLATKVLSSSTLVRRVAKSKGRARRTGLGAARRKLTPPTKPKYISIFISQGGLGVIIRDFLTNFDNNLYFILEWEAQLCVIQWIEN